MTATTFAGAGLLAYMLGIRHAFDADHIAAIDDTTRLMMLRGRRPTGVGFFFALGHSAVVLILAALVAVGAAQLSNRDLGLFRSVGGNVSILVAISFLLLVSVLNSVVLRGLVKLWGDYRNGTLESGALEAITADRGLMNRLLGGRTRTLITSSWHMAPVGFLFGLGLETASEITLLTLSASAAAAGKIPLLAVLSLPILFAAGMTMMDTIDSLVMSRAYSWAADEPGRRLFFNVATTAGTVLVGMLVASVYLAAFVSGHIDWDNSVDRALTSFGDISSHFELLGYGIAAFFAISWLVAGLLWMVRYRHMVKPSLSH
ncbi:HoxN/HupN/NixA family nickel/cobalt transporter [Rhodococcus sp. 06-418-1B]|nr:HoxN/HupN/NixA family nickel/cobalt transporter [Rhodococcus sp. 06-418-1B]